MKHFAFEATPTVQNGKVTSWKLCYLDPPKEPSCGDDSAGSPYPNVTVEKGDTNATFKFAIKDGMGVVFAPKPSPVEYPPASPGPIWIHEKGEPNGPGVHRQIKDVDLHSPTGAGKTVLTFKDRNDNVGELVLKYQLNFVGPDGQPAKALDPDITNGGKGRWDSDTAAVLIGAAVLAALAAGLVAGIVASVVAARALRRELRKHGVGSGTTTPTGGKTSGPADRNPQG